MPPLYDLRCHTCQSVTERQCKIADRLSQRCGVCGDLMEIVVAPVRGKMAGTVLQGGGPDRFTADMLGIKTGDLPGYLKADR